MDENTKKQAQKIFNDLGMDTTTAVNIFLKQVVRTNSIPFPLQLDTPNEETRKAIAEAEKMLKNPATQKFSNIDELFEDLQE